jgi:hypothetical protein
MRWPHDFLPWMTMDACLAEAESDIHGVGEGKKWFILSRLSMDDSNWHPWGIHAPKAMRPGRGSESQNQ